MSFCPVCKDEFREGFSVCPDCGVALVAALPEDPAKPAESGWAEEVDKSMSKAAERALEKENEPVLLTLANNYMESEMLCRRLEAYGIPAMRKYRGADGYLHVYMGGNNESIEIYVPKSVWETAAKLIETGTVPESDALTAAIKRSGQKDDDTVDKTRNRKARIVFWLFFGGPLLLLVLVGFARLLGWL